MKKALTPVLLAFSLNAFAQTTTTTTLTPTVTPETTTTAAPSASTTTTTSTGTVSVKKSPFSGDLTTETFVNRIVDPKDNDTYSFNTNLYPMFNYEVLNNTLLSLYPQLVFERENKVNSEYENKLGYVAFKVLQKNILTEDVHGAKFDIDGRYYSYPTAQAKKTQSDINGKFNVRTYLTKQISENFSLNNHNRVWIVDERETTAPTVATRSLDLRLTPTYSWGDKISTGVLFQYLNDHYDLRPSKKTASQIYVAPNLGYAATDNLSFLVELYYQPYTSNLDNWFEQNNKDEYTVVPAVDYSFTKDFSAHLEAVFPLLKDGGSFIGRDFSKNVSFELDLALKAF